MIATDTIRAVSRKIDPNRRHNTFEVYYQLLKDVFRYLGMIS
jgi:hypothetical protein